MDLALSVKVGSYRYDPLSELHHKKFLEPGVLLEVRIQAAGGFGRLLPFDSAIPFMEEHVLERISALEYSINTLSKRVDSLMETIERVAASNFIDHTMIETLTDSLESAGIDLANLEAEWRKRIDSRILETEEVDRSATECSASWTRTAGRTESSSACGSKNRTTCSSRTARAKACTS